jgi:hypothetical protein
MTNLFATQVKIFKALFWTSTQKHLGGGTVHFGFRFVVFCVFLSCSVYYQKVVCVLLLLRNAGGRDGKKDARNPPFFIPGG